MSRSDAENVRSEVFSYRPSLFYSFYRGPLNPLPTLHNTAMISLSRTKRLPTPLVKSSLTATPTITPSRIPTLSFSHHSRPFQSLYSPRFTFSTSHGKGKNKVYNASSPLLSSPKTLATFQHLGHARYRITERLGHPPSFHTSARREAIPLIPVGISVVKACSHLPSFLPRR